MIPVTGRPGIQAAGVMDFPNMIIRNLVISKRERKNKRYWVIYLGVMLIGLLILFFEK